MKLKTRFAGSGAAAAAAAAVAAVAALFSVQSARAGGPVAAEPETMQHVAVCDMYGAGFYYVPGTETCVKISGYIDVQYEYTSHEDADLDLGNDVMVSLSRDSIGEAVFLGRVNFDVREETDYGTLRSYIRLEGEGDNSSEGGVTAKDVYLELGGFATGYRTTALETGGHTGLMLDGYYGGGRHMFADYTFSANGLTLTAGVQLDSGASLAEADGPVDILVDGEGGWGALVPANVGAGGDAKSADPYIVVTYSGDMFSLRAKYGSDTSESEDFYGVDGSVTPMDGLTLRAYWEASTGYNDYAASANGITYLTGTYELNGTTSAVSGDDFFVQAEQSWGVSAAYAVTDDVSIAAGYAVSSFDDYDSFGVEDMEGITIGIDWTPVPNLIVRANYRRQTWGVENVSEAASNEFRIRIRRSF